MTNETTSSSFFGDGVFDWQFAASERGKRWELYTYNEHEYWGDFRARNRTPDFPPGPSDPSASILPTRSSRQPRAPGIAVATMGAFTTEALSSTTVSGTMSIEARVRWRCPTGGTRSITSVTSALQ